jgi:hypothetical protein
MGGDVSPGTARKILLALEASPPSPTAMALLSGEEQAPEVVERKTKPRESKEPERLGRRRPAA